MMGKRIYATAILFLLGIAAYSQNDTMYVMKNGIVMHKLSVKPDDVDSIIFYKPQNLLTGIFTDTRDNRNYRYTTIGAQIWMAENLAYLPKVDTVTAGSEDLNTGKYYYVYNFAPKQEDSEPSQVVAAKATTYYQTYGALYNWNASLDACPAGWHLPSDAEWTTLTDYLGGKSIAGGKLKEAGTTHWASPNTDATNESFFSALPAGYRWDGGEFALISTQTLWWSSTENSSSTAWQYDLSNNSGSVNRTNFSKYVGFSVRCVKD